MCQKRFIRRPELIKKTGLGQTTLYNLERAGQFPPHVLLTPRCAVWDEEQVEVWMAARMRSPAAPSNIPDASTRRRTGLKALA